MNPTKDPIPTEARASKETKDISSIVDHREYIAKVYVDRFVLRLPTDSDQLGREDFSIVNQLTTYSQL